MALIPIKNLTVDSPTGLKINSASNTTFTIGLGRCLDSTLVFDLELDTNNAPLTYITVDTATTGVNGLDTGTLAQGLYYVYVIGDSTRMHKTAGIASLVLPVGFAATNPVLPTGYDCSRCIGFFAVDGSAHIIPFKTETYGSYRELSYSDGQQVLNGGTAYSAYTAVSLASCVPPTIAKKVTFLVAITPVASTGAGDTISLVPTGTTTSTPTAALSGAVAGVVQYGQLAVRKGYNGNASVDYKLAANGDAASLWVSLVTYTMPSILRD